MHAIIRTRRSLSRNYPPPPASQFMSLPDVAALAELISGEAAASARRAKRTYLIMVVWRLLDGAGLLCFRSLGMADVVALTSTSLVRVSVAVKLCDA